MFSRSILARSLVSRVAAPAARVSAPRLLPSAVRASSTAMARVENNTQDPITHQPVELFQSRATHDESLARHRNLRVSYTKLNEILRPLRGLAVDEALIQLKLSNRRAANPVGMCLKNARTNAINNFQMDPARLYIHRAESTKGVLTKSPEFKGRGRIGFRVNNRAHLTIVVKEQPQTVSAEKERRVGYYGPKHSTIARTLARLREAGVYRSPWGDRTSAITNVTAGVPPVATPEQPQAAEVAAKTE